MPFAWGGPAGEGSIRVQPEDFRVIEVPLVSPCGEGEHSWLYVRKRNSNTEWVARQLARFAQVSPSCVSFAGLKDRHAVTEQWFSVQLPGRADPDWQSLDNDEFQVVQIHRHSRKLKAGALRGNRFQLRVCNVTAPAKDVEDRLQRIAAGGFPNAFGPQRFGHDGGNLVAAAQLFRSPGRRISRHKRGLYLSAVRSALFNLVLASRIRDGIWNKALPGDALQLEAKSACFVADEIDEAINARIEALEIHPTGPMCGEGDTLSTGQAAAYEDRQLQPFSDWIEALAGFRLAKARRSLRVVAGQLNWQRETDGSWMLDFFLPSGAYATSLLREVFELGDGE